MPTSEEQTQTRAVTAVRLRFALGGKATDVALPAEVPLADLLPAVLPQFGAQWVEQGADHEGWIAQRVGEAALDEDRTIAELGLLDGETVHLRPRADQLAPIDYDDLVDGVGEQVREHPGAWNPNRTRWMLRLGAVAALLLGLPLLLGSGSGTVQLGITAGGTVLLLGAAALVARGSADGQVATLLVAVATCFSAVTGVLLLMLLDPVATPMMALTCGSVGALAALAIGLVAVADAALLFTGAVTLCVALAVPGLIGSVFPASPQQASAIGLVLILIAGVFVPSASFRLSGLTLPMLPTSADELTEDIDPVPHRIVVDRGQATVGYSMALHVGFGLAQSVLLPLLVAEANGWLQVFSLVVAFLLFLRSRHPDGLVQRWAIIVPATLCVAANLLRVAGQEELLDRALALWLPAVVAGVLLLVFARTLPEHRLRPYWGRAVDILESLTAIAVLPILLQVLGVYATMRGLNG